MWKRTRVGEFPRRPPGCVPDAALLSQVAGHHHVRKKVGLFDVGHIVQTKYVNDLSPLPSEPSSHNRIHTPRSDRFRGATSAAFLEWLTPSSPASLSPRSSTLSVLLNDKGGIIDDTIVPKHSERRETRSRSRAVR